MVGLALLSLVLTLQPVGHQAKAKQPIAENALVLIKAANKIRLPYYDRATLTQITERQPEAARKFLADMKPAAKIFELLSKASRMDFLKMPYFKDTNAMDVEIALTSKLSPWIMMPRCHDVLGDGDKAAQELADANHFTRLMYRDRGPYIRYIRAVGFEASVDRAMIMFASGPTSTPTQLRKVLASQVPLGFSRESAKATLRIEAMDYLPWALASWQETYSANPSAATGDAAKDPIQVVRAHHKRPFELLATIAMMSKGISFEIENLSHPYAKRRLDFDTTFQAMLAPVTLGQDPAELPATLTPSLIATTNPLGKVLAADELQAYSSANKSVARAEMLNAATRLFITLAIYMKQNGHLPDSLHDLPEYATTPGLVIDPATGTEFGYSKQDRKLILSNEKDFNLVSPKGAPRYNFSFPAGS